LHFSSSASSTTSSDQLQHDFFIATISQSELMFSTTAIITSVRACVCVRVRLSLLPAQHSSLIQTLTQVPGIDHNTSLLEPAIANSRAGSPKTNHGLFPLGCCDHSYTNHRLTPRRPHAGLHRESLARSLACTHTHKLTCEAAKGKTQKTQKTKNKMPDFY
jgi:hypothetical protein